MWFSKAQISFYSYLTPVWKYILKVGQNHLHKDLHTVHTVAKEIFLKHMNINNTEKDLDIEELKVFGGN